MSLFLNPGILLGALLSVGYASLFHLWTGRDLRDLLLYLMVAGLGFAGGQWAGQLDRLALWRIGQIHVLEASLGAFLFLVATRLLIR